MKYVKMLGLAAVAAAALMAFVGASTASATVLCKTVPTGTPTGTTCPEGWALKAGDKIHAVLVAGTHATLTSNESFKPNITCKESTVEGEVTEEGDATHTTSGIITVLTFGNCGEATVTVLNKGSLEIHWDPETHNGTVTGTGTEITTVVPSIFGNIHCIYKTNATDLGTLTGSKKANETAVLHAESQAIPFIETSSLCPPKPTWDATYEVTTPDTLTVAGHT